MFGRGKEDKLVLIRFGNGLIQTRKYLVCIILVRSSLKKLKVKFF